MKNIFIVIFTMITSLSLIAQSKKGKIYDAASKEPLSGVTIKIADRMIYSGVDGSFTLPENTLEIEISSIGYLTRKVKVQGAAVNIALERDNNQMQEVVVTANRTAQKRSEAPVAISTISKQTIEDTKAQRMDQLINKVSGVFMVSLGNEQHQMSIRQPMTTKSLFLYMEDGVPIRTTGVYNHNALLELNLASAKSVEVIKGPSSALYGSEAIGGAVNVLTQAAPALTGGSVSVQRNDQGYTRTDAQVGTTIGKFGILVSGYYAKKQDGPVEFTDFTKKAFSIRTDYKPTEKTSWVNTFALVDYYSDMNGSIDSLKFTQKNYSSMNSFTYRSVYALRMKSMLNHQWNSQAQTNVSFVYRDNAIGQNPAYSIGSTGAATPTKFKGQINENAFKTFALYANHTHKFNWLNSKIDVGASLDFSPQSYYAKFIWITKDLALNKYVSYDAPAVDSFLSKYKTGIMNMASYFDFEATLAKNLRFVAAMRYDNFQYFFINNIPTSASVATASTINSFGKFTPKLGLTYNYKKIGFYTNYSEGYVPPQLTELYSSVKVAPYLLPQTFKNIEVGGWASLMKNRIYLDWSIYKLLGTNEIVSTKQADGTSINQNAGSTKHVGIEYGITVKPVKDLMVRFSGTNAKHNYVTNVVKGVDFSGYEMSAAPKFVSNAEIMYKPSFLKGFRIGAEWQHQGKYFMDDFNKYTYPGFDVFNLRAGYKINHFEVWVNALNASNKYYAIISSKNATTSGSSSYSYTLGDPREITVGLAYHFGKN